LVIAFGVVSALGRALLTQPVSVTDDELRGPVETMTVSMSLQQSVCTELKEMASVLEAEIADDSFQGVQMFEPDAGCTFAFFLSTDCFFCIHVSISSSSLAI
jgi:hypothetical protein